MHIKIGGYQDLGSELISMSNLPFFSGACYMKDDVSHIIL